MKEDKYVCVMFPYPSGDGLHVGHFYNYAIIDSYCNYLRFKGHDVFQPFGYDSFGLPTEIYADKVGKEPSEVAETNINNFREQMKRMNTQYEEVLITSSEEYQKHSQWIFTKLYEKGLAYKKVGVVNYDPVLKTVLANEQVENGISKRSGAVVEQKELNQWYFKITDYKDRLIKNLETIDYPESTINAQRHWLENLNDWCVSRQRKWGCPIPIEGETDTMDTFVDSSFYYVMYCIEKGMMPEQVDLYVGGKEHACMHLIYARFINMFLYDIGVVDFEEPFKKVIHQGMILKSTETKMGPVVEKMSKSKGNVVNPDNYDPRELRFYLMFIGHYFDGGVFNDKNIKGVRRFIKRWDVWLEETGEDEIDITDFKNTIFSYTESFKFNKVVSEFMTFYNKNKSKKVTEEGRRILNELLNIYIPEQV